MTTFEEELARNGRLIYTNVGDSMLPLIREGKDLLIIEPPQGRLKKYDIPLYRRDSGQYVLHRIVQVRETDYICCGDNRTHRESGVTDRQIIGVLTGLVRGGRELSVRDPRLRLYARLWCGWYPLHVLLLRAVRRLRRMRRKR